MNRFEDAIARELQLRVKARTRSVRALARWAAASLPPGALVADGVALVVSRLGDGDPDALAARVMTETPDRFGRNWESGPAHGREGLWTAARTRSRRGLPSRSGAPGAGG
ncbi:MAG TPA: hypothetical protein VG499_11475 [Actinomycetota bacterium]|nr:hypothetical protein [Actinomycetota bacterium]